MFSPQHNRLALKNTLMTIIGLAGVLFCKNEQTPKMDYRLSREARGGLKATAGKIATTL